jgi:hypothetical protein
MTAPSRPAIGPWLGHNSWIGPVAAVVVGGLLRDMRFGRQIFAIGLGAGG